VLDTNILISACMKAGGLEARLVEMAIAGAIEFCVTKEVMGEYVDVVNRRKFVTWRETGSQSLESLGRVAIFVHPKNRVQVAKDPDDNRFLECAEAAGAEFLVTGNLRHYPAEWAGAKIVNARAFFDLTGMTERTDSRPDL
jgi:putative PIN family toxin of toxin-antitoxin system